MRKSLLLLSGILVLIILGFTAVSHRGLLGLYRLEKNQAELELRLTELQAENEKLRSEIERLKTDPAYLEKVAREELGMVREDEIVFQFREPAQP